MDEYIASHTETRFSHGVCPACLKRLQEGSLPLGDSGRP
jgi:hypothetical protein